jgi:DNA-binding SARP family transcriptional activator
VVAMEFLVLGALEVRDGEQVLSLGGPRQRALLAFLLLHANHVVPNERLLDAVWGADLERGRKSGLHVRISQLRKRLGAARIITRPPGYLLEVKPGELDLDRFEQRASDGRRALADGELEQAARLLDEALGLWRGAPLGDVALEPVAAADVARIDELRWAAIEGRIEARLLLGRHDELIGELEAAVAEQPLRERLREHLMVVLYRAGRPADALAAYREARHTWVEELGIEPGRRLQGLERAILVQDPALDLPPRGGESPAGYAHDERKLVTVLLADVVAAEDLERTRAWLDRVREVARTEVATAGGVIGSSTGGGILATFGAPAAQEDHTERALGVANVLQAKLGGIVPLRVAVETGEIIAGRSGLTGPPVSFAMQLLSGAKSGDVLVGVRASAAHTRRQPRPGGARLAPLVGRGAELDALRAEYRRARADAGARLVTIVGDAGVGKSRLAKEFVAGLSAESPAPYALAGSCISYGHALTYRALGDVLREILGVRESDSRDTILDRLGARQILGLTLGLDAAGDLHPLAALERLRIAWRDLLTELVADRPAVVLVEDLHWAQPDLLDLLEFVIDVTGPLLVVTTARPELLTSRPSWGRRRDASAVWLEPLAPDDAARLVAEAPEHVREAVLEKAEGNPFFIEELVAQVHAGGDAAAIPDSVQAVLAARIDRLAPLEKHALQAASVIGRAFWREPVRELLGDALPNFELLEERDFIRPHARSSFEGMRELAFKHALTREVAYGSLPQTRRLRLHASVARWLEAFGGGRDEHAALLAHHYAEAVRSDGADLAWAGADADHAAIRRKAVSWLRRAADLAIGRYEIDDAIALLRRALGLEQDDDARCELWTTVARASALKFDGEAFWTAMEQALSLARDDPTRAEICSRLAVESYVRAGMWTRTPALERVGEWVASALELAPPQTASRARALIAKACRDIDDRDAADEAAAIAERLDDPELCVHAWDACATVAMAAAEYEAAWEWRTRRLRLLDRISDPDLRTIISETPYAACIATCRFEQAREIARLNDELTSSLTPHHRLHGVAIRVEVEELLGEWRTIIDLEERIRETVFANAHNPCLRNARSLLVCAIAAACLSDADKAAELERSADDLGMQHNPILDAPRLQLVLLRGDSDRASELLHSIEANQGWYLRGHGTSLATLIARLDAHAMLGHADHVERAAARLISPGTFVEPFASRALGVVRHDADLLARAAARFHELALEWHAGQTLLLLNS